MKRTVLGVMTAVLALSASAAVVHAQNPMTFGIGAGATFPTGDFGEGSNTGFHGLVTVGAMPALLPFGVRIDGMYHSIGGDDFSEGGINFTGATADILGLTANGIFGMPGMIVASPYLIGGVGYYGLKPKTDQFELDRTNAFGLNIGIGAKFNLSGFSTFLEGRYHHVMQSDEDGGKYQFIPLTFGIMF